VRRNISAR